MSQMPRESVRLGFLLMSSVLDLALLPLLILAAVLSRIIRRGSTIGLGPHPLINNVYHAKALTLKGFSAETYVTSTYHITSEFDHLLTRRSLYARGIDIVTKRAYWHVITRYSVLYIYFNGGPLGQTPWLWRLEPFILHLAGIKIVAMPYGSDVMSLARCPNLNYVNAVAKDYPDMYQRDSRVRRRVQLWQRGADCVISGCDWVDYMEFWHVLVPAHFSIDIERPVVEREHDFTQLRPLRVLHAPNHRAIKGTEQVLLAVADLAAEGIPIDLVLVEKKPNAEVREALVECDVVLDQLVIGWYAMFALEGMAMSKPVICFLRDDLVDLYLSAGAISEPPPLISATQLTIKDRLRELALNRGSLRQIGASGHAYALKYHSLEAIGEVFCKVNQDLGIDPVNK